MALTDEHKRKLSEALKGRVLTDEMKKKISEARLKGNRVITSETRRKLSESRKGKPMSEETKRKIRIAAGAWQALFRLPQALNPFNDALLAFIFISHKVFRWSLAPIALVIMIPTSYILHVYAGGWFSLFWILQQLFYFLAILGKLFEHKQVRIKLFFIPYYFVVTNYCMIAGFVRFIKGN